MPEVPIPPGTAFTMTPLPDGRFALQLAPNGIDIKPVADGGYHLQSVEAPPEPLTLEDKLRAYVKHSLVGMQSKLNDVVRVLQNVITGFVRGIFAFFFTLMIAAFILIDLEKVHAFLRGLFPDEHARGLRRDRRRHRSRSVRRDPRPVADLPDQRRRSRTSACSSSA